MSGTTIWAELDTVARPRAQPVPHLAGGRRPAQPGRLPLLGRPQHPRVDAAGVEQRPLPAARRALGALLHVEDRRRLAHHPRLPGGARARPARLPRGRRPLEAAATDERARNFYRAVADRHRRRRCATPSAWRRRRRRWRRSSTRDAAQSERRAELLEMARICRKVPAGPAESLHEALSVILLLQIALHMENMNAGLSLGRLDAWLQPYFLTDIAKAQTDEEREAVVRRAIELVGSFFLQCTDHLPLVPSVGMRLFGGSSSDQAMTLGGVDRDGQQRRLRHDLHLPQGRRDADAARPQRERPLPPGGQLAGVPAPPVRGEPDHRVDALDPQRRGGHRRARQPGVRHRGRARLGRHRLRRADELRAAHRPHQLHDAQHGGGAGDGAQRRLSPADGRAGRPAHRRRRRRLALRHLRQVPRRLQGATRLRHRAVGRVQQPARAGAPVPAPDAAAVVAHPRLPGERPRRHPRRREVQQLRRGPGVGRRRRRLPDGDQEAGLRGEGGRLRDAAAGAPRRLRRPRGAARAHHEARAQVRLRRAGHAGDGRGRHRLRLRRLPGAGELPRRPLHQRLLVHVEPRGLRRRSPARCPAAGSGGRRSRPA